MRLNINLATRPYRDVRQFLRTWGTGTVLLALLTAGLCWYTFHAWSQTRSGRADVALVQNEIDALNQQRESGIALLNQPQNRAVANQSAFLNGLIARRSFSWTQLFMELERIMPARLHVTSIAPSLNKRNQIEIHMVVAGDAREQAVELVRRLEDSPSFQQPELRSETVAQNVSGTPNMAGGDRVQFDISMLYVPKATTENAAADKGPQPQTANDDKAAKPDMAKKEGDKVATPVKGKTDGNKAVKPDIAKKDGDKALRPVGDKSDKKKIRACPEGQRGQREGGGGRQGGDSMMMRNVAQAQRGLIVVIVCLALIDVTALALLLSPAIRSSKSTQAELQALQAELAQKRIQAVPALDMDKKLAEARTQISDFYAHDFVSRYSEISEALAKAATESHVQLANINYIPLKPTAAEAKNCSEH